MADSKNYKVLLNTGNALDGKIKVVVLDSNGQNDQIKYWDHTLIGIFEQNRDKLQQFNIK